MFESLIMSLFKPVFWRLLRVLQAVLISVETSVACGIFCCTVTFLFGAEFGSVKKTVDAKNLTESRNRGMFFLYLKMLYCISGASHFWPQRKVCFRLAQNLYYLRGDPFRHSVTGGSFLSFSHVARVSMLHVRTLSVVYKQRVSTMKGVWGASTQADELQQPRHRRAD
jgi:hypothetical protein